MITLSHATFRLLVTVWNRLVDTLQNILGYLMLQIYYITYEYIRNTFLLRIGVAIKDFRKILI